ncbi:lectin [Mycena sanguinolenta]|nr:lectin [Mycena sanguinolenta]
MVSQFIYTLLAFTALHLVPHVAALDFGAAQWIWTNEISGGNAPVGARAFRKDFTPPLGKTPVEANILITVDNGLTLYVNGGEIGTGDDFRYAELFCVALRPCLNVFAVTGVNTGGPAGLLATIQITYSDGSTSTIASDTTWRASTTVPAGYEQLSFDATSWTPAIAQGGYGVSPWGQIAIPSTPPVLSLTNANWIWTNEVVNGNASPGSRAFRRIYTPPTGQTATSATIIMVADNGYTLYVNGVPVGAGTDWQAAQKYTVNLAPAPSVLFAVKATNGGTVNNPAGLLAAIEITTAECNCTSGAYLRSDASWKSSTSTPVGFELPGFDDSTWAAATVEGAYGMGPWGAVTVTDVPGPINAVAGGLAVNSTATAT